MNKNEFAPLPPMGWNSFDYYDTSVTEADIKANADYMAAHLKPCGWEYMVVDIQWYAHGAGSRRAEYEYIPFSGLEMDGCSRLMPDPARFPSAAGGAGFAPLAAYVHGLGLKFGIHIMRGIPRMAAHNHCPVLGCGKTADAVADPASVCEWNPDMYGVRNNQAGQDYYDSLMALYAGWGVDFVKCDDICRRPECAFEVEMLGKAIQKCGRAIVLSLSPGPALIDHAWNYEKNANMWRITDDFWDDWALLKGMFARCELWQAHVRAGCYPDCDMLPLGYLGKGFGAERQTRLTRDEQRTMMSLWCLFGSPLMLGAEMTELDDWTLSLLTNRQVLALRTPDCKPFQLRRDERSAVWTAKNDKDGSAYLALFNLADEEAEVAVKLAEAETDSGCLTELWTGETLTPAGGTAAKTLPAHGCALYKM